MRAGKALAEAVAVHSHPHKKYPTALSCLTVVAARSLRRLAEKLTGRLTEQALRRSLLHWQRHTATAAAKRRAEGRLRKFAMSQGALRQRLVCSAWAEVAMRAARNRSTVRSSLLRIRQRATARSFGSWQELHHAATSKRAKVEKAAQRWLHAALTKAFGAW